MGRRHDNDVRLRGQRGFEIPMDPHVANQAGGCNQSWFGWFADLNLDVLPRLEQTSVTAANRTKSDDDDPAEFVGTTDDNLAAGCGGAGAAGGIQHTGEFAYFLQLQ